MMRLIAFALLLALPAFAAAKPAPFRVYETKSTHPDRVEIGRMLKEGRDDVIDPFTIIAVHIADRGGLSIAYVDTQSSSPSNPDSRPFVAVVIRRKGGAWSEIWAESSGGSFECGEGLIYFRKLNNYLKKQRIKLPSFAPEISASMQMGLKNEDACHFGDLWLDENILGPLPK
jgi:hypothetical protein